MGWQLGCINSVQTSRRHYLPIRKFYVRIRTCTAVSSTSATSSFLGHNMPLSKGLRREHAKASVPNLP
eukprot:268917-Chlamydomonas_euryale.AAC.1